MVDWRFTQYLCPQCKYDVEQTLADGFYQCPECGLAIDWESCDRTEQPIGAARRAVIYLIWVSPSGALIAHLAALSSPTASLILLPFSIFSLAAVLGTWVWIEHRLGAPEPLPAAIGPAIGRCARTSCCGARLCARGCLLRSWLGEMTR